MTPSWPVPDATGYAGNGQWSPGVRRGRWCGGCSEVLSLFPLEVERRWTIYYVDDPALAELGGRSFVCRRREVTDGGGGDTLKCVD